MKKNLFLILGVCVLLLVTGCGNQSTGSNNNDGANNSGGVTEQEVINTSNVTCKNTVGLGVRFRNGMLAIEEGDEDVSLTMGLLEKADKTGYEEAIGNMNWARIVTFGNDDHITGIYETAEYVFTDNTISKSTIKAFQEYEKKTLYKCTVTAIENGVKVFCPKDISELSEHYKNISKEEFYKEYEDSPYTCTMNH